MPAIVARDGITRFTPSERLTSACRVIAPITTALPSSLMPFRLPSPPRSISSVGFASRNFRVGISVMPPATSLASSLASRLAASSRLAALTYSNSYIGPLPCLFRGHRCLVLLDRAPQPFRRQRHLDMADAERLQRIDDGIGDRRRRADRAGLAAAFDPERVVRAKRDIRRQHEVRQVVGAG